jgi:hypothetical protein
MANQNANNDDQSDQSAAETARLNRYATTASTTAIDVNNGNGEELPGRRLKNPLGDFASYTYQLTLYMITPDAYELFVAADRKNINSAQTKTGGAFIVAQSGGINKTDNRRAPGMDLDYYIDNLKITQAISGAATDSATNNTSLSFDIIEPYGFSFNTQLLKAFEQLKQQSSIPDYKDSKSAFRQFFILGIRFQGYTPDGVPVTSSQLSTSDTFNPSQSSSGVFERFYDIIINELHFKIDGNSTKYAIKASTIAPSTGFGNKYGKIENITPVTAATVGEALTQLMNTLTKNQQGRKIPITYAIEYRGNADSIKNASLINPGDIAKAKLPGGTAQNASQVTEASAVSSLPNNTQRTVQFTAGISVPRAIEEIIKQSTYLTNAFNVLFTTSKTPNPDTKSPNVKTQSKPPAIQWYNLGSEIKVLGFDKIAGEFSYQITYVIQPYATPATFSPYAKAKAYYGPHKRYEYWFTGHNSEIIDFNQQLNNNYFNIMLTPETNNPTSNNPTYVEGPGIPTMTNQQNNYDKNGLLNAGATAQNQYLTSLYDPEGWAEAKIKILGDPDFLMSDSPGSINAVYRQFYGNDNFTINPNGGQVFIEVDFKEAKDYDINSGLLTINESILFWVPQNVIKANTNIKGIVYNVITVESTFNDGNFTQLLTSNLNPLPYLEGATMQPAASSENRESTNTAGNDRTTGSQTGASSTVPSAGGTVSQNNGYVPDDSTGIDAQVKRIQQSKQSNPSTNPVKVIPTNFGIVADDDSTSYASTTQAGVAATTPKTGAASNIRPPALTPGGRIRIRGNPLDIQPI